MAGGLSLRKLSGGLTALVLDALVLPNGDASHPVLTYDAGTGSFVPGAAGIATLGLTVNSSLTGVGTSGSPLGVTFGTTGTSACVGNDSRLSDARAPTGAAGGGLGGTYPNPTVLIVGVSGGAATYRGATTIDTSEIEAISSDVTIAVKKTYHDVDTSANRTLTLPAGAAVGDVHVLTDVTGGADTHPTTVNVASAGTVNGSASISLATKWYSRGFRKIGSSSWVAFQ